MSAGRHIVGRSILPRADGCYAGTMTLFGYAYFLEITRSGDGLQIVAFDGPATGWARIPLLDGEEQEGQP
jgi:hypothetical protein